MELGRIRCVTESAITAAMKSINAANPLFPYRTSALHPMQTEASYGASCVRPTRSGAVRKRHFQLLR
jgi:hypothetical protein